MPAIGVLRLLLLALITPLEAVRSTISVENKIASHPRVLCTEDGVLFEVETEQPFVGQLYVKNEYENPKCRAAFGETENRPGAVFRLNFHECSMRRRRMVQPKGMLYSVTMMVQFHPAFVTKGDKAYQIRCFYQEADAGNVTFALDVSSLTTTVVDATHPLPSCSYSIRLKALDGPKASIASVGDTVVHIFRCEESADNIYRLLVKDCYVDDGKKSKRQIVGSDGCSMDSDIMQTPVYSESKLEAMAEASVFKWPDESTVYFQCQISLCMRDTGTCEYITPPKCDRKSYKRSVAVDTVEFDSEVKRITVLDIGREADVLHQRRNFFQSLTAGPNRSMDYDEDGRDSEAEVDVDQSMRYRSVTCYGVETLITFGTLFFAASVLMTILLAKLRFSRNLSTTDSEGCWSYCNCINDKTVSMYQPEAYSVDYSSPTMTFTN